MAGSSAQLEPGIYVVEGEAVGSLAPKFRGMSYAFMVTNAMRAGSHLQMWCADLVAAGKVPDGHDLAGKDCWALHGHPWGNVFVVDGAALIECDKSFNQRHVWKHSDDFKGKLFSEAAAPPVSAKTFPTENFVQAVIDKNPELNEPYSPNTQTIVEACAGYSQTLPTDPRLRQQELVRLYTAETPLYHEMNQSLRDDCHDRMRYFGAYIRELRDVFKTDHEDQIITPFKGKVWRGITFDDPDSAIQQYAEGSIFVWPAFTSMSTDQGAAMGFGNIVFEIACYPPPGHYEDDHPEYAPASVEEWSCYKSEKEVLFPPNIRFRVQSVQVPDDDNGLSSPLVICETVGFDTDGGIVEFSRMRGEDGEQDSGEGTEVEGEALKELRALLEGQLAEQREELAALHGRLDECCARLEALAPASALDALSSQLGQRFAPATEVAELRAQLEREAAERSAAQAAWREGEARLGTRCDDLQVRLTELAGQVCQEREAVRKRIDDVRAEGAKEHGALEREVSRLSQQLQASLADTLRAQKGLEREVSKLSSQAQEQSSADRQRNNEMDQILKGLTDRCYMTNMILATEKLKHETLEIKSMLASEAKPARAAGRRAAAPANPRATLDAAVQGVSDIRGTLEALRQYLPREGHAGLNAAGFSSAFPPRTAGERELARESPRPLSELGSTDEPGQQPGAERVAAGGALQAARAARRPSAPSLSGE